MGAEHPDRPLTDHELAVLRGVVDGQTNQQIAAAIHMSFSGVKYYVTRLCRRFGQPNRTRLAAYALTTGLVPPPGAGPPA